MQKQLIAIMDIKANDIVGPIMLHNNIVTAVRMFEDVIRMENSQIGQHVADHNLVSLGTVEVFDDNKIDVQPNVQILLTGQEWLDHNNKEK